MADSEFNGKVAVVTGAASGIGRSILTAFLERGAKGVLVDIDDEWGHNIEDGMRRAGHDIFFVKTDVSNGEDVAHLFETIVNRYREVDIVVNAAGIRVRNEIVDLSEQEWDAQIGIQLKGPFLMCRAAARQMIKQGRGGRLINIGSNVIAMPHRGCAPHAVSKAGVVQLTKVLALELGRYAITVNVVAPSLTEVAWPARKLPPSREFLASFMPEVPLGGRLARPEENVDAVLFFASDKAGFITGQLLSVDGGYSAGKMCVQGATTPWMPPARSAL